MEKFLKKPAEETEIPAEPPAAVQSASDPTKEGPPPALHCCYRCQLVKAEGRCVGRQKKIWYCKECQNFDEKLKRITSGSVIGKMFKDMDKDEQDEFRANYKDMNAAALRNQLTVTFT